MSEKPPLIIYRFFTKYVPKMQSKPDGRVVPMNNGELVPMDMVEFGPIGSAGRSQVVERIDVLSKIRKSAGANPAVMQSQAIWEFIEPFYKAWKNNQELPQEGTPLAAWNALTPEQAEVLRVNGVKSVDAMATLTDTHITRIPIPNMRALIAQAKAFISATDSNRFTAEMKAKDETIANLAAKVDQLASMVAAGKAEVPLEPVKRKPGRPRKSEAQAAA